MKTVLAIDMLPNGEPLTIECVQPPDAERGDQIRPFLAHKPANYFHHVEAALAGNCDTLETRFYIGLLDGEVVGNIMTVETGGVGIFGHVFTRPDQRRKGICDAILLRQIEDFRQRNGHVLLLGTGYQSPAYRIYEKHGFRDWPIGPKGHMRYDTPGDADFEEGFFSSKELKVVTAQWKHWPLVALLGAVPTPVRLRHLTFDLWNVGLLEGAYCQFFYRYGSQADAFAMALESSAGAVMVFATCVPDERWPDIALLDVFAHPLVGAADLARLIDALPSSRYKVQCYADTNDAPKIAALMEAGFQQTAILPQQFRQEEEWHDALLFTRG